MDPADDNVELQFFRHKWKEELRTDISDVAKTNRRSDDGGENQLKRRYQTARNSKSKENNFQGVFHCFGEEVRQLGDQLDPEECSNDNSGNSAKSPRMPEDKSTNENNEIVLLDLPEPSDCKILQRVQSEKPICTKNNRKSLLDQLIEDIDEITTIPFFDLSLPKEVGIQIFNHLGFKELCSCAQVSKSWKILAEDELIWYRVGCKLGYVRERDCTVMDRANWKGFVRGSILKERELRRNWKERICRLSNLEFERGETAVNLLI